MKARIKKLWVDALRSGEFKQGEGCLKDDDKFCCLGVLCELYRREEGCEWGTSGRLILSNHDGGAYYLPPVVQAWAGLSEDNPRVNSAKGAHLAVVNDCGGTFPEIAGLIEEQL